MTEIRIYFEGDRTLRPGFHQFLSQLRDAARGKRIAFQLIATKGTPEADFKTARRVYPNAWNVLLRDSEAANVPEKDSIFWMVQLMEAWFLADPDLLADYYGAGFERGALKKNPKVEEIPKADVLECLKQATRKTQKGRYHKTAHAPKILELLRPDKVRKAAPNCDRLFRKILEGIESD